MPQYWTAVADLSCPAWCVMQNVAWHAALWHVSESHMLDLGCAGDRLRREAMEVRAARYRADDSDQSTWVPAVELAHHVDNRYRVVHLTSQDARSLAALLTHAADQLDKSQ